MNKIINLCLLLVNILTVTSFILVILYKDIIVEIYNKTLKDDSRRYLKLKNVFTEPFYNLHFMVMIFDLTYLLLFIIFNNKKLSGMFGLRTDKIASQSSLGYSNLTLEFFFAFLIKIVGHVISIFFITCSNEEIDKAREEDKKRLSEAGVYLAILLWVDVASILVYLILYAAKFVKIRRIKSKNYITSGKNTFIAVSVENKFREIK